MKILISIDHLYLHGGVEKVITSRVNYLVNNYDVDIMILTTEQQNQQPRYPLDPKIKLVDLGIGYDRKISYFSKTNLQASVKHFFSQKKLLKEYKPDVIISVNYNFDHYWFPLIKSNAKLYKERHGSRYAEDQARKKSGFLKKLKFSINDWIEKKYDAIIVLNEDEKKYVRTNNAFVIPNPVEPQQIHSELKSNKVIAAGRISPVKGFDQLISAFAIVHKTNPSWILDIYGQDYLDTADQLKCQISALGLENVVFLRESVNDLPSLMADYSIYAMSSETECFPMVLLEALSVGLPVVSYDCPNGPRNIVSDRKDGILVHQNNIEELAAALNLLMNDEDLRQKMGDNGRKNVDRFLPDEIMKRWQTLLNLRHV